MTPDDKEEKPKKTPPEPTKPAPKPEKWPLPLPPDRDNLREVRRLDHEDRDIEIKKDEKP